MAQFGGSMGAPGNPRMGSLLGTKPNIGSIGPPPPGNDILTEGSNPIITEGGNNLVTET